MYEPDPAVLATWLTLEEAARAYGVSERTMRRRLAAHAVDAGHLPGTHGQEWRIRPPTGQGGAIPFDTPAAPGAQPAASGEGGPLVPLARVEALLAPIVDERDRLRGEVAQLQAARLADARAAADTRAADARHAGELAGRLSALEEELSRLRNQAPPAPVPLRRRWPWQR